MPEVQEVFRMATQKVDQDHGALERQVARQRKAARNRRVGVFATVLVLDRGHRRRLRVHARATRRGYRRCAGADAGAPGFGSSIVDLNTGQIDRASREHRCGRAPTSRSPPITRSSPTAAVAARPIPSTWRTSTAPGSTRSRRTDRTSSARSGPRTARCSCISSGRIDPAVSGTCSSRMSPPANGPRSRTSIRRKSGTGGSRSRASRRPSLRLLPAPARQPPAPGLGHLGRADHRRHAEHRPEKRRVGGLIRRFRQESRLLSPVRVVTSRA